MEQAHMEVIDGIEGEPTGDISIDLKLIPDYVRDALVSPLKAIIEEYYKQPGNEEKYQAWLKERKRRQRVKKKGDDDYEIPHMPVLQQQP